MGVYFALAMNTVISSRVYLNLTLVAHGGGRDGVTTGAFSSLHTGWANPPEGTEMEVGQDTTFGSKRIHRCIPLTTFTTVSACLFSFPLSLALYPLTSLTVTPSPQTVLSVESNTQPQAKPDSAA
jgi:hypothetical protein